MSIKLIATDLDGTLLENDHLSISRQNTEALVRASEKGVSIVIATGRTWDLLSDIAAKIPVTNYAILSNGASLYDINARSFTQLKEISFEIWHPIYQYLKQNRCIIEIFEKGKCYLEKDKLINFNNPNMTDEYADALKKHITGVNNVDSYLSQKSIEKINVLFTPQENFEQVHNMLISRPDISVTSSIPGNMEINLRDVNKGLALKTLCMNLNITADEVMVFGDADNDIEMLEWAGWSFAMKNAREDIKKRAHFIADSNTENGVAKAINTYILSSD